MTTKDTLALALEALGELAEHGAYSLSIAEPAITAIKQAQLKEKCAFPEVCPDHVHEFNALQAQQAQEPVNCALCGEAASALNDAWLYYTNNEGANGNALGRAIDRAATLLLTAPKQAEPNIVTKSELITKLRNAGVVRHSTAVELVDFISNVRITNDKTKSTSN